jgi:hypothetical protein
MTDFADTKPMSLYGDAIGEKNQDYYLSKFEDFDDKGPGLHASWNWAAFFFSAFWALYRKMYAWFFALWAIATVATVLLKVPNPQIQQGVGIGYIVCFLGFGAYANALYHRKVKSQIAAAQKSSPDASRVSRRLSASGGVNKWVAIVCGAVPVIGIVAAVALPAYQDYTKRQAVAGKPVLPPAKPSQVDEFLDGVPKPAQAPSLGLKPFTGALDGETPANADKQFLKSQGIGGNQDLADVTAWGDAQILARISNEVDVQKARSFAFMWQRQIILKLRLSPERALFLGYLAVTTNYDEKKWICRPDMKQYGGIEILPDGRYKELFECYFPE